MDAPVRLHDELSVRGGKRGDIDLVKGAIRHDQNHMLSAEARLDRIPDRPPELFPGRGYFAGLPSGVVVQASLRGPGDPLTPAGNQRIDHF